MLDAAESWANEVVEAYRQAEKDINDANRAHLNRVKQLADSFRQTAPVPLEDFAVNIEGEVASFLDPLALDAYNTYQSRVAHIHDSYSGNPADDYDAYYRYYDQQEQQARAAYFQTVGQEALKMLDSNSGPNFATRYMELIQAGWDAAKQWISDVADADVALAVAIATAEANIMRAEDAGQARYISAVSRLQQDFRQDLKAEETKLENAMAQAVNQRKRDLAKADQEQAKSKAAANKQFADTIADARKTYVDDYADAWAALEKTMSDEWGKLQNSLAEANRDWVDGVVAADKDWVDSVSQAADDYETDMTAAYRDAVFAVRTAVKRYSSDTSLAWTSALARYYVADLNIGTVSGAWTRYAASIVDAWQSAQGTAADAANDFSLAVQQADKHHDRALAEAKHAHAKAEAQALVDATAAAVAAQREYDDAYRQAVVDRAKALGKAAQAQQKQLAEAEQKEIDTQADAYELAVREAANENQQVWTSHANSVGQLVQGVVAGLHAQADALLEQSLLLSEEKAREHVEDAREAAELKKQILVGVAEELIKLKLAETKRALQDSILHLKHNLHWLQNPSNNSNVPINPSAPSYVSSPFYTLQHDAMSLAVHLRDVGDKLHAGMESAAYYNEPEYSDQYGASPGADALAVLREVFGFIEGQTKPVYDQSGDYIGKLDPLDGMVVRSVGNGGGGYQSNARTLAEVVAHDQVSPLWGTVDWDKFFGGRTNADDVYTDDSHLTLTDKAMFFLVGQERLAKPGNLADDLLLTVRVVTEATSLIDPTPLSDGLNGLTKVIDGENADAAMTFAGMLVPGGADKLARFAKHVKVSKFDDAVEAIADSRMVMDNAVSKADETMAAIRASDNAPPVSFAPNRVDDAIANRMRVENTAQQLRNTELPRGLGGRTISATERAEINAFGDRARALGLVENPHRTGSWGRIENGKFREVGRIDTPVPGMGGHQAQTHLWIDGVGNHLPPNTPLPGE